MTVVSSDDVRHLAQLCSLQLAEGEEDPLVKNINELLGYVEQLDALDTTGVEPTYQVTDLENIYRNDTVIDYGVSREQLLALAPAQLNRQVKVPKVL